MPVLATAVPVEPKFSVSALLNVKPACVPVNGVFSLSCSDCHWKPKVRLCFPLVQSTLSCTSNVFWASWEPGELPPSHPAGGFVPPLSVMPENPDPATPPGRPLSPALDG